MSPQSVTPVSIEYSELVSTGPSPSLLLEAFGKGAHGIIAVKNVPGYASLKSSLADSIVHLANLQPEALKQLELPEASWTVGWSRGVEGFSGNDEKEGAEGEEPAEGKVDSGKGSFYAHCFHDNPKESAKNRKAQVEQALRNPSGIHENHENMEVLKRHFSSDDFPGAGYEFLHENVWPSPALSPSFQRNFLEASSMMKEVARLLLKGVDQMLRQKNLVEGGRLSLEDAALDESFFSVGRALCYYPNEEEWCGWHNDNSIITGLFGSQFYKQVSSDAGNAKTFEKLPGSPDPSCGLYVQGRDGEVLKVDMPLNSLGFQLGEACQILSGGELVATPHMVKGCQVPDVCRVQLAVFFQPNWFDPLTPPPSSSEQQICEAGVVIPEVPKLGKRWKHGMSFGKYLKKSVEEYYRNAKNQETEGEMERENTKTSA